MRIGNYKLTHRLGAGGMGIVFRAVDQLGRPFAIKMIGSLAAVQATLHVDKALQNVAALDLNRRMMLVREARLAMELNHPNIARTFDYGQHGGLLYIVVEYLEGRSLDKVIPIHGAVRLSTKIKMIRQICDALEYAHRQGVIHRDVKPANTFVLLDASVKVLDFGLAARLREPLPGQTAFAGTPQYMAPEIVVASNVYDARADIWSTGVTLYQLLTGRLPFNAPSLRQLLDIITHEPFPRLDSGLPYARELEAILDRALAKKPSERYASAGDFAYDLRRLEENVAKHRSLPAVRSSEAVKEDLWWASTLLQLPDRPDMPVDQPTETVSMISGNIRARRGRHTVRFAEYNVKVFPLIKLGTIVAGYFALFMFALYMFGSPPWAKIMDILRAASINRTVPPLLVFRVPLYFFGFGIPGAVAIGIVLGVLAFWERFAEIAHCRTCKTWMSHLSRIDRFSYTEKSRAHASSDCLAALKENLWKDAAKLLSMHGEVFSPKQKTAVPLVRYYLDFYVCRHCGDESAILTTEDGVGRILNPRETYEGAYKVKNGAATRPSRVQRRLQFVEAIRRATTLVWESIDRSSAVFAIVASLVLGLYYYPLLPSLLMDLENKGSITINSDPSGQLVLVDGTPAVAPKTFSWTYGSSHTITGLADRQINGDVYRFQGLTARYSSNFNPFYADNQVCGYWRIPRPTQCTVAIIMAKERAEQTMNPLYTFIFSKAVASDLQNHQNKSP